MTSSLTTPLPSTTALAFRTIPMKLLTSILLLSVPLAHADSILLPLSAVGSDVTGTVLLDFDEDFSTFSILFDITNPSGINIFGTAGAHIHCGEESGPVVVPLVSADRATTAPQLGLAADGFTAANITDPTCGTTLEEIYQSLLNDEAYVNVHSTENPSGEVRGRYRPVFEVTFQLSGEKEVPPVMTDVTGTATFSAFLDRYQSALIVDNPSGIELFGGIGAHVHCGGPTENGPVMLVLQDGTNTTALSAQAVRTLMDTDVLETPCGATTVEEVVVNLRLGLAYVNVHSVPNPSGEVRGSGDSTTISFPLTGDNEIPPVVSTASGTATFQIGDGIMGFQLNISNPDGLGIADEPGIHIHCAPSDANGPVGAFLVFPDVDGITDTELLFSGVLTDIDVIPTDCGSTLNELAGALSATEAYVNVHSTENPSGEIRGQYENEPDPGTSGASLIGSIAVVWGAIVATILM